MKIKLPKIIENGFVQMINELIAKDRHPDYLKQVLVDFDNYKRAFDNAFTLENSNKKVYKFRVNYKNKKPVWREIEVYGDQYFVDLAEEIIFSMDWDNDHMHGFSLTEKGKYMFDKDSHFFYAPFWEDDPFPTYKTSQIKICHIDYTKYSRLGFIFDFGDGHEFDVQFKGTRDRKPDEYVENFPILVDQRGVAPEQYPDLDDGIEEFCDDKNCTECKGKREIDKFLDNMMEDFNREMNATNELPFKSL